MSVILGVDIDGVVLPRALFAPLPTIAGGFPCVLADVPALFRSNSEARPGRNAMRHYACHSMATIATLPVRDVVARNAFLWFWTTGPLIAIGAHIQVVRAWGFEPTAMGFVWVKLNPKASSSQFTERDLFFGPGLTTRKNAEYVVLGRRGRPERTSQGRVRNHHRATAGAQPQARRGLSADRALLRRPSPRPVPPRARDRMDSLRRRDDQVRRVRHRASHHDQHRMTNSESNNLQP